MKSKIIMVAALLGLMATACNKENEIQQQDLTQTPITIKATYGSSSKVSYTETGNAINAKWQSGDKLLVVYNNNVNTLDLISGVGTTSATFSGSITGTPADGASLVCYVKDQNTPSGTITVNGDGSYIYTSDAFLEQDGTLAGAAKLNLYCGWTRFSSTSDINCTFSVNTSMMKFTVSGISDDAGETATITYKSGNTKVSKTTFTVSGGGNIIYLTIPAGMYSGMQSLVYTCRGKELNYCLPNTQANFTAGQTYSKGIEFINTYIIPLTFEAKTAGSTVEFQLWPGYHRDLNYSINGGTWTTYTYPETITLENVGDKVSFRGDNIQFCTTTSPSIYCSCTGQCYIYGNIMSLLYSSEFATSTTLQGDYTFYQLFRNNTAIYSHPSKSLVLPATELSRFCYKEMFNYCPNLTSAPSLPATTLRQGCYDCMFKSCTGLLSAPELPAITLVDDCYSGMFSGCTNLTSAPDLFATTLTNSCYASMFYGCSILRSIKCLATNIPNSSCTYGWLEGVAATGTFTKATSMSNWTPGVNGIPSGWTVNNQ